ncbi:MAG: bifunctional folylpolyglutamate synthase/dihydrofolate synthase, partial [Candidatus Rokuibacteriota bacterium]
GKGSVAAMTASALREAGLRTGLYSSPHLCTFRERIRIDGEPIGEQALVDAASMLWPHIGKEGASFFEASTVIAFLALAQAGVDIAVVEVGLGGRLDATNVIEPEVAVVTNVSLDHVELLGSTLSAVAREKAGILKRGVPAVTGVVEAEPLAVLRERAAEVGAPLHTLESSDVQVVTTGRTGTDLSVRTARWGLTQLRTALAGAHQARNAALAVRALELLPDALRPELDAVSAGLRAVRWPGRLQTERLLARTWVFDVAHNVAAVQALVRALPELGLPRPLVALVGVLGDKDWKKMMVPIAAAADAVVLTQPPTAPADRRWDPDRVLALVPMPGAEVVHDFSDALARARQLAGRGGDGTVLVTGSFHTVGDALIELGLAPYGADPPP